MFTPSPSSPAPLSAAGVAFLADPATQTLAESLKKETDPLRLSSRLSKMLEPESRRWLMDYLQLKPRLLEKLGRSDLLCDRLALEQSTARDLGEWKAALWPTGSSLHDLCCGMGGDSLFVPPSVRVQGIDLDEARIAMYDFNMERLDLERRALKADVRTLESQADFFCIDPARRAELGQNQRDLTQVTPSLEEVRLLARRYGGGMVKLPPGFPSEALPRHSEVLFAGGHADCRECLLLMGSLAPEEGRVRALSLGAKTRLWSASQEETRRSLPVDQPGRFLREPSPVLLRSHLFVPLAHAAGLWQLDSRIAYLSCHSLPKDVEGFHCYSIADYCPLGTSAVQAMLRRHDIGKLTLKKRGVEIVPEAEIKRLKPKGSREGILVYTRLRDEKSALLVFPLSSPTET